MRANINLATENDTYITETQIFPALKIPLWTAAELGLLPTP